MAGTAGHLDVLAAQGKRRAGVVEPFQRNPGKSGRRMAAAAFRTEPSLVRIRVTIGAGCVGQGLVERDHCTGSIALERKPCRFVALFAGHGGVAAGQGITRGIVPESRRLTPLPGVVAAGTP
jgi:hypothetical protein